MKIELAWPASAHKAIMPIFLPFMGCGRRCVFCAQDRQSGVERISSPNELGKRLLETRISLEKFREKRGRTAELAFYGGTFTALSEQAWTICLEFVQSCRSRELISAWRCSTRPDALDESRLAELEKLGCGTIELGIQSFDDEALRLSGRDYDKTVALEACLKVRKKGMRLGLHLLPGMPGVGQNTFINDISQARLLETGLLRIHPCLVLAGTALEKLWRSGKFKTWSLPETISILALAWNMARKANITVSRIGLAPEKSLANSILAGPCHPALGSRVQARALFYAVKEELALKSAGGQLRQIMLPRFVQGCFWGWNGELKKAWLELGIGRENVGYWDKNNIEAEIKP